MAVLTDADIRLNDVWQLTQATNGDAPIVSGLDCVYQDIRLEALSQEGELFYDSAWGWSLLDFVQSEDDELLRLEIQSRIKEKLSRRSEIDVESISTVVDFNDDTLNVHVTFQFVDESQSRSLDIVVDRVSVEVISSD
jgi:hypothetical protein|nr:MAG TPA: baseplate wedge protein [Caudoviricetes sp.]